MLPALEAARVVDMDAIAGLVVVFMAGVAAGLALAAVVLFAEGAVMRDAARQEVSRDGSA